MKKFLVTILALVYLTSSVGATVHLHYCMDKLVTWGLGHEKSGKKSCPNCGMSKSTTDKHCAKESKGCCKDTQKQVKLENDQKLSEASFKLAKIFAEIISSAFPNFSFKYVSSISVEYPVTHAPPLTEYIPLFVLNCVYRI